MTADSGRELPLEGGLHNTPTGWSIRLPVRIEQITISKQTVVRERVRLNRKRIDDVAHVTASVRHEELKTTSSGAVDHVDAR